MTFHTFPEVPFEFFEKETYFWQDHFDEGKNIITNLIRYCGFKTLHQDCFLYRWLQEQIRYFKFGGTEEMRKWITVPAGSEFWQKLPTYKMRVSDEQMRKWVELLHDHHAMLQKHCKGPSWNRFYKSSRTDFTRPVSVAMVRHKAGPGIGSTRGQYTIRSKVSRYFARLRHLLTVAAWACFASRPTQVW